MPFEWGPPLDPPGGRLEERYGYRPAPPWPPGHIRAANYQVCLACPDQRPRCADCPFDQPAWGGHRYPDDGRKVEPEHRRSLLHRLLRRKATR